jgi:hypothetical protein
VGDYGFLSNPRRKQKTLISRGERSIRGGKRDQEFKRGEREHKK